MIYYLSRTLERPGCTLGILEGPNLKEPMFTLEDPWKDNQRNESRIHAGTYQCVPHGWEPDSPVRFKRAWRLVNVPGRSAILIHPGNTAVDTHGCILVGSAVNGTKLEASVNAMNTLRRVIGPNSFTLEITDAFMR